MSGRCCENPPTLSGGGNEAGQVQEIGGLISYVCGPSDSNTAVLLVSDVFGFDAPKLRKLADKVAAAGFYTVVPDFLHGDPYPSDGSVPIMDWIKNHRADQAFEESKPVIEALKTKGITNIGAAGFCWGAKVVVALAKDAYVNAGVLLHPSFVSLEDIQGVKVPISVLGAEIDKMSPPELLKQFEVALNEKPEVPSFVKIFKGVAHGWTVRYKDENEEEIRCAEEAHQDMLDWFVKHLN